MVFNRGWIKGLVSVLDVRDDGISLAEGVGVGALFSFFCFQQRSLVDLFSCGIAWCWFGTLQELFLLLWLVAFQDF